jgi:hypothetical protein
MSVANPALRAIQAGALIALAFLVGCTPPTPNKPDGAKKSEAVGAADKNEEEIKTAFAALQSAVKAEDVDKIWGLLAKDSQDEAEREAKVVRDGFGKLTNKKKAAFQEKMGLSAKEMTEMTGKLYLKSKPFTEEVDDLPDSKLDKVVVAGESATVHYTDEEGKRETIDVVREQGQWKFDVSVPKAVLK